MQPAPTHFQPYRNTPRGGCFACAHFHGQMTGRVLGREDLPGVHVVCEHRGGVQVIGTPRDGCCAWEREPGADDK